MNLQPPFSLLIDLVTFALGTYGAIVLVNEFVELDRFPSPRQVLHILRNRWKAALALLTANLLFFFRLYIGLMK